MSRSGLQPNVAQNVPLVGGLCHAADFNQMRPKMCPSSEDFVTQQTLTKCGPKCAPHWRTLSRSGLQPNMVQNVPLVQGLWTLTKYDPKICPLMDDFVLLRGLTTYGSTTYSLLKMAGAKQTDSNHRSMQNSNCCVQLQCHVINTLRDIRANKL